MSKGVVIFLVVLFLIPVAYSLSIKDLIARYSFSATSPQMNVTEFKDFMIDKNSNGINDTLVFELTTNNADDIFIFVINLLDKNGILTNETNVTLNAGINKLNIMLNTILLSQNQFNYSVKIYNSSFSLKYRKDNILTQEYTNYEKGFEILSIKDSKVDKMLKVNVTINSYINGTFETILFLAYNNSIISIKENKTITNSIQDLIFNFDNETIKRTHYIGNFNISSVKIGKKVIKINAVISFYDFRDFAETAYLSEFSDTGIDTDNDDEFNLLQINANAKIFNDNHYNILLGLYDLFDNIVEIKNTTFFLASGDNNLSILINGSKIYGKKLNGPFIVKYTKLFENGNLVDLINNAYITGNYNFNDFNKPNLPDLIVNISASGEYHYGINNVSIEVIIKNTGNKHAFNVFAEIFDNNTFTKTNKSNLLNVNSQIVHKFNFTNFSDFEITAIADLNDFVEELNESNNAERLIIKLNKKPTLEPINNITINETAKIIINLSASDPNEDELSFSINFSKFSNSFNVFQLNTTTNDSGEYVLEAIVSDGFLSDSLVFKITILNASENDIDNDGINDIIDKLIGNEKSVNTSTINLTIFIGNSSDLSRFFNESFRVRFFDANLTIIEFDFNFSKNVLNLTNLTIDKQLPNQKGSFFVRGLRMPEGTRKTLYVDKINVSLNKLCIKDDNIPSISNISSKCNKRMEFKIRCNGRSTKRFYKCTLNSTTNKYKVEGLGYSGIIQVK